MSVITRRQKLGTAAAAALCLAALAGCGGGSSSSAAGPAAPMSSMTMSTSPGSSSSSQTSGSMSSMIMIQNFAYSGLKSVKAGATVMVMNEDSEAHTVTADSGGAFDVVVPPGATKTFTAPPKPGTYAYHCNYHSNMHGSLVVKP